MLSVKVTVDLIEIRPGESVHHCLEVTRNEACSEDPIGDALVEAGEHARGAVASDYGAKP